MEHVLQSQPVSSPALSEKEKLSLQTPQAVMTPLSFAKARLGQHVTFDSPKSPLTRPQECFTPSYSRTSAVSGQPVRVPPPPTSPLSAWLMEIDDPG